MRFYAALAEGKTVGTSLRDARQASSRADAKENFVWANYMLYGDPSREYRGAESLTQSFSDQTVAKWKRILRAGGRSANLRRHPLISLVGVLVLAVVYGVYSRCYAATSAPIAISAGHSAMTLANDASPPGIAPLSLSMNIIGQRKEPDGSYTEVVVREGSVLQSRDHFQVHVETNKGSYIYVLLFDSQGDATQLFPDPKIEHPGFLDGGRKIAVPDKDLWFWLDENPGTETVYVLASEEPLHNIRGLLSKMNKASEGERKRLSGEIKQRIKIVERGVGGVAKGKTVSYPLSDGRLVQKVTEIVAGTVAVVRAISFEHR